MKNLEKQKQYSLKGGLFALLSLVFVIFILGLINPEKKIPNIIEGEIIYISKEQNSDVVPPFTFKADIDAVKNNDRAITSTIKVTKEVYSSFLHLNVKKGKSFFARFVENSEGVYSVEELAVENPSHKSGPMHYEFLSEGRAIWN